MGKQFGPIKCKVCGGEHRGTLCTKFNSVRVLPPKPAPARLALPKPTQVPGAQNAIPASSSGRTPDFGSGKARSNRAAGAKKASVRQQSKKAKKTKPRTAHRKAYLAAKAQERRDAKKMAMDVKTYRAFLAARAQ